jgi:hypothetical protein
MLFEILTTIKEENMPFKSLTDLPMRINPQIKKKSVYLCPERKAWIYPWVLLVYMTDFDILTGGQNEKIP